MYHNLGVLKFGLQMLVADIVNEAVVGMSVMNDYEFIMDLRENVLRFCQEKITFFMAEVIGSTNHSIKQVMVIKNQLTGVEKRNPCCWMQKWKN